MASQIFELGILISMKDAASARLDGVTVKLREMGKEGKVALKQFDELKRDLAKGLAQGGVGVAGLLALRGGIKTAGDFEAAMADLRLSIEEVGTDGRINFAKLNDEMNRFEKLGMDLGNVLPGSTQDFIEMFSTLKQGGLSAQTILDGTGQAVAHLAVVTNQLPKGLAEPFAQYVQQFKLTGKEATQLADVLAKLKFSTGLSPQELIEGSKFFQLRVGTGLGMTGLQGAEQSGRLLATLRRAGLEGGIGGRELAGMFGEMNFKRKEQIEQLSALRSKGINLQFFDKKGGFLGIENVFAQMETLRGLSHSGRMEVLEKLFNKEAAGPANIMIDAGLQGWKDTNAEIDRGTQLQDKINEKVSTYNAKMESVLGTIENLKATTFTPMLETLKPILDAANSVVGSLQAWAKEHQTIAGVATHLFGLGSAALVVVGGFKAMRNAWGLWKIASAVGRGDLQYIRQLGDEVTTTAGKTAAAGQKVAFYNRQLKGIPAMIGTTVTLMLATEVIAYIAKLKAEADQAWAEARVAIEGTAKGTEKLYSMGLSPDRLKEITRPGMAASSKDFIDNITDVKTFSFNPLGGFRGYRPIEHLEPKQLAAQFRDLMPELRIPSQLALFKDLIDKSSKLKAEDKAALWTGAKTAFPKAFEFYSQALAKAQGDEARALDLLVQADTKAAAASKGSAEALTAIFNPAVTRAASELDKIKALGDDGSGKGKPGGKGPAIGGPSRAIGGMVERSGWAYVHEREDIVPARVTAGYRGRGAGASGSGLAVGSVNLHIHPPAGSAMANDPNVFAKRVMEIVTHQVRRQRERR